MFKPQKDAVRLEPRLERSDNIQAKLTEAGIDVMEYDARWGRYRIRLAKGAIHKHEDLLKELLMKAYREAA